MRKLILALKAIIIGGSMLVPGVSGGTMALLLGIYNDMISAVSSFFKDKKKNAIYLLFIGLFGIIGMVLFAKPLSILTEKYNFVMMYFFLGAVAGSVPFIFRKAHETESKKAYTSQKIITAVVYVIVGIILVTLLGMIPQDMMDLGNWNGVGGYVMLLCTGIVAAVALVLPGISVSYMLLVLGMYEKTINSITNFEVEFIMPLGIGLLLGIILTTKLLENALNKHPRPTYLIILGFIIGSMVSVFPGIPNGIYLVLSPISFVAGFMSIYLLGKLDKE